MTGICHLRAASPPLLHRYLLGPSKIRSFGAAALQYDYYDDDDEEELEVGGVRSLDDSERLVEGRGVQWVFIGNPSAKKHMYAERLSKLLDVPHISMGSLVRQELNPRSSIYKQIANAVNQGKLVPEDIIFGLLSKRLEEGCYKGETGFILDGIPRSRIQAEILDQIADIDLVVNFKCTEECLVKKHLGSAICPHCQESRGIGNLGSTSFGITSQPSLLKPLNGVDSREEKLRIFAEQRKPLEDYYRKQKKLLDFQVTSGSGETWQGLLAALHLQHMNAAIHSTSQKLYA
ncbi:hypothetical protein GIB67_009304 [Kingdonia uniflora]|uniref:adenylate kinase n=1 Tax=Kingdonia uniflora TaxID=39325 RepID=A0A7J7N2P9_9MAGN|nr:hypothetical protein GIB67_009304 [Kingdonia uniflora]